MISDAAKIEMLSIIRDALRPDPKITISEWADSYRILPRVSSAEPGPYRTSRMPYLREPMDMLSPFHPVEQIKVMKGTQLGWTEVGNNWILATIHLYPAPTLLVLPTVQLAERHSKQKIGPSIDGCPEVRKRVLPEKSRSSGNTLFIKEFQNGVLVLSGANSAASFRSSSYKNIFLDDVDGFPGDVEDEGSPLDLAKNRADAFPDRKIFIVSTPTIAGRSNIEEEFQNSDQRKYHVRCPDCGRRQIIEWSSIVFDVDDNGMVLPDVRLKCYHCGSLIHEGYKTEMLARGEWIPQNPGHTYVGYHLSSLYSPLGFISWRKIATEFVEAKRALKGGSIAKMKRWVNTRLAETWEEDYDKISDTEISARVEEYNADVPAGVRVIVAGVDTQDDRLEVEVRGYGAYRESWGIEYKVLRGDPALPDVWRQLDMLLSKKYHHESGHEMQIYAMAIDMGGHRTDAVLEYTSKRSLRNVFAIKGSSQINAPLVAQRASRNKARKRSRKFYQVGVNVAKDMLFASLQIDTPGPGYSHFPRGRGYDEEYFKQLTGARRNKEGRWVDARKRVEALDCRVYADAALALAGVDLEYLEKGNIYLGIVGVDRKRRIISKGVRR